MRLDLVSAPAVEISNRVKMKRVVSRSKQKVQETRKKVYNAMGRAATIDLCFKVLDLLIDFGCDSIQWIHPTIRQRPSYV